MPKIIGIINSSFIPKDSSQPIEGSTFHVTSPISPERGEGHSTDHFYVTKAKLARLPFTPTIGMEVEPLYNKYSKVESLLLLNPSDDEFIDV